MRHNPGYGIMGRFMREGRVIAFRAAKAFERRHLHKVLRNSILGHRAAMADGRSGTGEKALGPVDAFDGVNARGGFGVVVFGQIIDLLDVNRIALEKRNSIFGFLAGGGVGLGADNLVGIDNEAAMLALAHIRLVARRAETIGSVSTANKA
jgi:hypothetical protein